MFARLKQAHNRVSIGTLGQISAAICAIGSIGLLISNKVLHYRVRNMSHVEEAMAVLNEHEQLRKLLGEPIRVGRPDLSDRKQNYISDNESKLRIPVCGSRFGGFLTVLAIRNSPDAQLQTQVLELELDGEDRDRYLLFERRGDEYSAAFPTKIVKEKRPRLKRD